MPCDTGETPPLDAGRIVRALNDHGVDFIVIGGIAVLAHGHPRATFDIDVIARATAGNLRSLADALTELGARVFGVDADLLDVDPTDPDQLASGANWTLVTDAGRLDLMPAAEGARPYDALWEDSVAVDTPDMSFRVVGVEDLLRMKTASARPKDRDDIAALVAITGVQSPVSQGADTTDWPDAFPNPTPMPTAGVAQPPVCGQWMPIARAPCALPPRHRGRHRRIR